MRRKLRGCPLPLLGECIPSNTKSPGPRPTSVPSGILIDPAIWPQQIWAKNWGLCAFGEGEVGPHLTMWPRLRPTSMPSFILIRPTVWPQCSNVTGRTDRTGQDRQRTDSLGRTVLQTVAQKLDSIRTKLREEIDFQVCPYGDYGNGTAAAARRSAGYSD